MFDHSYFPTILIVRNNYEKIELDSPILTSFRVVCLAESENAVVLSWVQENQPDLILLELTHDSESSGSLVTNLRMDWLTRNIPIAVLSNKFAPRTIADLDYDAHLNLPYSPERLDATICSLVKNPACKMFVS